MGGCILALSLQRNSSSSSCPILKIRVYCVCSILFAKRRIPRERDSLSLVSIRITNTQLFGTRPKATPSPKDPKKESLSLYIIQTTFRDFILRGFQHPQACIHYCCWLHLKNTENKNFFFCFELYISNSCKKIIFLDNCFCLKLRKFKKTKRRKK